MKFKHDNRHKGNDVNIKTHLKTTSQDYKNPSKDSNIYVSKLINQNKNKNAFINESLPNLKKNIQNIFSNEDSKEKAFQYLIQKSKDRSANASKDYNRKTLKTLEMKPFIKIKESKEPKMISPYITNNFSLKQKVKTYDSTKSCNDLRPPIKGKKNYMNNNMTYRPSFVSRKYIYEDEPLNQNNIYRENNCIKNQNNTYTNLLTKNNANYSNRNKSHKYEHIAIYNTYNNTFNNYKIPKSNYHKNLGNQTFNNVQQYSCKSNSNNKNYYIDNNPYKDYLKNSNLSNVKRKFLKNKNNNHFIDISDTEHTLKGKDKKYNISTSLPSNDEELQNIKMNYTKRVKNRIKVQKNENLNMKKQTTKMNESLISNKSSNSFYVHKNFRYTKLNQKKNSKGDFNINLTKRICNTIDIDNNNENNMKTYVKRKNYYDIYGHKDIRVNTLDNKNITTDIGQSDDPASKINSIKVNIGKKLIKDYYNSPLSQRYNKYFINNNNKNINSSNNISKKKYEKRDTFPKNLNPNFMIIQKNNNSNEQVSDNDKNNIKKPNKDNKDNKYNKDNKDNKDDNNSNKIKYVFNDEEEIIEFIRKKYNKRKIDEILKRDDNIDNTNTNINDNDNDNDNEIGVNEPKKRKAKKFLGLMTTEEGKKIKQKNEELSNQIKQLKFENKNYQKELNEIKNKFDDLSKEINDIKEKK